MMLSAVALAHSSSPVLTLRSASEAATAPADVDTSNTSQSDKPVAAATGFNSAPLSKEAVTALQESSESSADTENQAGLSETEAAEVDALKERDQEVRAHEQAHATIGGQYAGSPSYEYQTGPNNQQYAVGGEVKIDTAEIPGDPEATLAKMDVVIRAALAPAEPSAQDRKVAAMAAAKKAEALVEINQQKQAERSGEASPDESAPTSAVGGSGAAGSAAPIIDLIA